MPQECFQLTDDELASYLDAGYSLIAGPYDSEDDCNAACGGSGSGSGDSGSGSSGSSGSSGDDCECSPLADTLYLCYTDLSNNCCWNFTLAQSGGVWTGDGSNGDCGTVTATLSCADSEWNLLFGETNYAPLIVNSCSPLNLSSGDDETFSLVVTDVVNDSCCSGSGS